MTNTNRDSSSHAVDNGTRRPTDLRSQVTMVPPVGQTTMNPGETKPSQPTVVCPSALPLPFTAGQYTATEILAQGGMSTTYFGHLTSDDSQEVVIKIPDISSPRTVELFENECKILTELHHPNIVPVLETGSLRSPGGNSYPFMVMKYIAGQTLRQKIDTQGKISWGEAVVLLDDIGGALQYLFENHFCHRDVKPANIVFDTDTKHWILVDFGIAKSEQNNIMATMTMAGQDSGTWDYMPPEQLEGKVVDIRCDIYALGTVVWEALIGKVPRRGTKLPSALRDDLPADVDVLIAKMVEHDPEDRYQTPAELLDALHSGAKKVEDWKKRKTELRKFTRYSMIAVSILITIAVVWIIGDFVAVAKAKEIYEKNQSSATIALRELKKVAAKTPFFWGKRYFDKTIPDLQKKANDELNRMREQYSAIKAKSKQEDGSDDDLESGRVACENFVRTWGKIFEDTEEVSYADRQGKRLGEILRCRNAIAEAEKITAKCEKGKADFRKALSLCREIEPSLTFDDLKQKMSENIAALKNAAITNAIELADEMCATGSGESIFNAYRHLLDVKSYAGEDNRLSQKMDDVDDRFWNYCSTKAQAEVKNNRFANARNNAEHYGRLGKQLGMTRNILKLDRFLKTIAEAEETYDWNETVNIADKYLEDNAFKPALDRIERFAKKYPNTKMDVAGAKKIVADRFAGHIISTNGTLDDCQEQFDIFAGLFSMQNENIPALQKKLCQRVRQEIVDIMRSSSTKTELLAQIKYTKCTANQTRYLKRLKKYAMDFAADPEKSEHLWYRFAHLYQRPPDGINPEKKTVYWVTITDFSYHMSDSDYKEYKGKNDADIRIIIKGNAADCEYSIDAPTNQQDWSVSTVNGKKIIFWVDTKKGPVCAGIEDADMLDCGPKRLVNFNSSQFSRSGETSYTFDSGTKISIKWTTI